MSYILYSSIARAGGVDLLMNLESFTREPYHPLLRRPPRQHRLASLRRTSGRALLRLGAALTARGRRWAAPAGRPALKLVGE